MAECDNCGAHVTMVWVRVFGVGGKVAGCPVCLDRGRSREAVRRAADAAGTTKSEGRVAGGDSRKRG